MKKTLLLFVLTLLSTLTASAYDAEIDGIYYNLIKKAKLAWVTSGDIKYTGYVNIPESFVYDGQTYNVKSIASEAFSGCTGLTSVTIPNSVTSIENAAFSGCSNLTTVFIGTGVETIDEAFVNCLELTDMYCFAKNVPTTNSNAFKGSYAEYATLYVPAALMATYKATEPWSSFGNYKDISNLPINEANFPDENFRNWILSQSYGSDGVLTEEEIAGVKKIEVYWRNIQNLQGIEFFTALEELSCNGNQLTSLDVSKNTALTSLDCSNNKISSLDVSKNTLLTTLGCGVNQITSLIVSQNTALKQLSCSSNQISSLDVSNNTMLTSLACNGNRLTSLDVSRCVELTSLSCSSNQLVSLDISRNTALKVLEISFNKFTSLDVSKNTALTKLQCTNNQLTSLDVSQNIALTELNSYSNKLTSLKVSNNSSLKRLQCNSNQLSAIDVSGCTALTHLTCSNNQLTSLDVSNNTMLTFLECASNQIASLSVSGHTALTQLTCSSNQLASLDVSGCTVLTNLSCNNNSQLTSLNVTGCTALNILYCQGCQLTSLNTAGCAAMTTMYCQDNQLTSLNVTGCTNLRWVECHKNKIKGFAMDALVESLPTVSGGNIRVINKTSEQNIMTTIQVAAAKAKGWKPYYSNDGFYWMEYDGSEPGVQNIDINESNFPDENFRTYLLTQGYGSDGVLSTIEIANVTSINVSKRNIKSLQGIEYFTSLLYLYCYENQLTSLDVSKNTKLQVLECYKNQINGSGMDALVESLPAVSNGTMNVIYNSNEQNVMLTTQVAKAKAKGWTPYYNHYSWGSSVWSEYAGVKPDVAVNATNFPDETFRNWILSQNYGSDGILTEKDIESVTLIKVSNLEIKSLQGIEYFTSLLYLHCVGCQLTSLDVSKNLALSALTCSLNQLTSLDVSKNTKLTTLYCDNNQLTSLDVSNNTMLKELWCGYNQLNSLILDKNTVLETLYCHHNQLTSLDVSGCTALKNLFYYQNQVKGKGADALVESLPKVYTSALYVLFPDEEQNVLTTTQVAVATAKGWTPYYYNGKKWITYAGIEPTQHGDVNGDGVVNGTDIQAIINLIVAGEYDAQADVNADGTVNGTDIQEVINIIVGGE